MRSALAKGDVVEVGHLGHRLKGTVSHLGAERVKEAALRVERFATASGQVTDAEEAVSDLERECEALGQVLTAYRPASGLADE